MVRGKASLDVDMIRVRNDASASHIRQAEPSVIDHGDLYRTPSQSQGLLMDELGRLINAHPSSYHLLGEIFSRSLIHLQMDSPRSEESCKTPSSLPHPSSACREDLGVIDTDIVTLAGVIIHLWRVMLLTL